MIHIEKCCICGKMARSHLIILGKNICSSCEDKIVQVKAQDDELKDMLAEFGDYYAMTPEERKEKSNGLFNESNDIAWGGVGFAIRMIAYAGYWYRNENRMRQALEMLSIEPDRSSRTPGRTDKDGNLVYTDVNITEYPRKIQEVEFANTNGISQWSLNYIETAKLYEMMNNE